MSSPPVTLRQHYRGGAAGLVFVWVPTDTPATVAITPDHALWAVLTDPSGATAWAGIADGRPQPLAGSGVWTLALGGPEYPAAMDVAVSVTAGYPFVVPGPGIVPSHFPEPTPALVCPAGEAHEWWVGVPAGQEQFTLQTWLRPGEVELCDPAGEAVDLTWPTLEACGYRTAVVPVSQPGWWRVQTAAAATPFRLTVWEGLPLFPALPAAPFAYGRLVCEVADGAGEALDARVEVFHGPQLVALGDTLAGEEAVFALPPGAYTVRAGQGVEYRPMVISADVAAGHTAHVKVNLFRGLPGLPGWAAGDLHMHSSAASDGGDPPAQVARAARAQGLSFVFISDAPAALREAGFDRQNVPGRFLALAGEEVWTPDVHANALNMPVSLAPLAVSDDTPESMRRWLAAVADQVAQGHPAALMLNHPSHLPETMAQQGYFRSWWLADDFPALALTENFDFPTWFGFLNQGRRLTGLWTTDMHDSTGLPPGRKRSWVQVGEELTAESIMAGLLAGRVFCSRDPGAMLFLRVNDAGLGETARPNAAGLVEVTLSAATTRPLDRLELIADGEVIRVWDGHGALEMDCQAALPATMGWLLARAYVTEEPWPRDGHSMEPLRLDGCVAFTNPVWVAGDE